MTRRRSAALLLALGALLLVGRIVSADGWIWTTLAATAFLVGYERQRVHGLLVVGCVLAGVSAGLLLGGTGIPGAFWVSVGVAVMAIDRVEPQEDKRTLRLGAGIAALGVLWGVASAGWLEDARFAVVLLLVGVLLLRDTGSPRSAGSGGAARAGAGKRPGAGRGRDGGSGRAAGPSS